MNSKVIIILLSLVAVVTCEEESSHSYGSAEDSLEYSSDESFEAPKYNFEFDVEDGYSGNDFQHQEARDDGNTKGSYTVQLPDGRLQKVTYYVDGDSGYVAEVSYEGEAQYPESSESKEYSESLESNEDSAPVSYNSKTTTTQKESDSNHKPLPKPSYSAPKPTPKLSYSTPKPTSKPSYSAPKPTTKPSYPSPKPIHKAYLSPESAPKPSYSDPKPTHKPSYSTSSKPSYEAPDSDESQEVPSY